MDRSHQIVKMLLEDEGEWDFTSSLEVSRSSIEIYGLPDQSVSGGSAEIKWHLEIDAREWGVKEMFPVLRSVRLDLILDDYRHEDPVEVPMQIVYNTAAERPADPNDAKAMAGFYEQDHGYTAEMKWNRHDFDSSMSVFPTSIEVDLKKKHIIVFFG